MRKLQIKRDDKWRWVFCSNRNGVMTTTDKAKALPQYACWAYEDLAHFQSKYGNDEFRLSA